jgi:hypothetical protein
MRILIHQNSASHSESLLRPLLAATLFLAVSVSASCRKPVRQAAPVAATASPAASKQPAERTADEIALIDESVNGDTAAVKTLLDHGVNPNTRDPEGRTPLTEAAYYGHTEIAKLLLDHGADVYTRKAHGETPFEMAASHPDIAQMIKREIDLLEAAAKGDVKLVKELWNKRARERARSRWPYPLTEAAGLVMGNSLLLERGADPNPGRTMEPLL